MLLDLPCSLSEGGERLQEGLYTQQIPTDHRQYPAAHAQCFHQRGRHCGLPWRDGEELSVALIPLCNTGLDGMCHRPQPSAMPDYRCEQPCLSELKEHRLECSLQRRLRSSLETPTYWCGRWLLSGYTQQLNDCDARTPVEMAALRTCRKSNLRRLARWYGR